jgi:hypothetical protein
LALTGTVGPLFGSDRNWWGFNIGGLGGPVFGFALWVGAGLFAAYPERVFPPSWSIAGRRSWAGLLSSTICGREPGAIQSDERDLRLRRDADRTGDWALTILIAWCVGFLIAQPAERLAWWLAPMIAANVLVGILIVKALVEHLYLVARYAWDRR